MTTFRKTRNRLELLEQRQCLSSIGFVSHDIVEDQSPSNMVLADIDGDNDFDIIMSISNYRLGWRLNAGDGTFGPFEVLAGESVDEIVASDFDQDGDPDILVITERGRGIAWYENDGDLTFKPKQVLVGTGQIKAGLAAADVDNDGDIDLLATSPPSQLNWYENSQGEFNIREVSSERLFRYQLGDYDSDGDLDVAYSGLWIENDGNGDFIDKHPIFDDVVDEWITGHGDLDGDGDIDFLTNFGWHENVDRRYEPTTIYPGRPENQAIAAITLDLDGDGDLDLMTQLQDDGGDNFDKFTLHENIDGEFRLLREFSPTQWLTRLHIKSFDAKDLNGDGTDDPLFLYYSGESFWYDGQDEHQLSNRTHPIIEGNELVDLDGDGDLDVLLVTSDGRGCADIGCSRQGVWYENGNGRGTEWIEHLILLFPKIAVGDIDGDGDNDIMSLDDTDGNTVWLENDSQTFRQRIAVQIDRRSSRYSSISLADVDEDSDLDVILHSDETLWFENLDGTGAFGPAQPIGADAGNMIVVDVEGDGDPDVIVGGRRGLVWYENDGTGSFDRRLVEGIEIGDLSAADMDGDGDQDLLVVSGLTIYEFKYLSNGTFAAKIAITSNAFEVRAVDLDQDDDMDLVFYDGRDYAWLENTSNPQPRRTLASRQTFGSIHFGDIDQDGDIDVFTGKRWHEQRLIGDVNDDGRFDSSDLVIVFQHAEYEDAFPMNSTFEEGDWNGDGDFNSSDLVFAFEGGNYAAARPLVQPAPIEFDRDFDDLVHGRKKKSQFAVTQL